MTLCVGMIVRTHNFPENDAVIIDTNSNNNTHMKGTEPRKNTVVFFDVHIKKWKCSPVLNFRDSELEFTEKYASDELLEHCFKQNEIMKEYNRKSSI